MSYTISKKKRNMGCDDGSQRDQPEVVRDKNDSKAVNIANKGQEYRFKIKFCNDIPAPYFI